MTTRTAHMALQMTRPSQTTSAPQAPSSPVGFDAQRALYSERLKDNRWKSLRQRVLRRDNHKCRCCGSTSNLQVHHRQYHVRPNGNWIAPWEYVSRLLITFCASCHKAGHTTHKVPTFKLPR